MVVSWYLKVIWLEVSDMLVNKGKKLPKMDTLLEREAVLRSAKIGEPFPITYCMMICNYYNELYAKDKRYAKADYKDGVQRVSLDNKSYFNIGGRLRRA